MMHHVDAVERARFGALGMVVFFIIGAAVAAAEGEWVLAVAGLLVAAAGGFLWHHYSHVTTHNE